MKGFGGVAALVALLLVAMGGQPLTAQSWRGDLGINGGGSWYSPLLGSDQIDNANGNVRFRAGWLVGAQGTFWLSPRIGLRANGTYTDRPLKQGNGFMASDNELWHDINLWSGTGDLMFRFKSPSATYRSGEMLPYLALGLGEKWIAPAGGGAFTAGGTNGIPIDVATAAGAGTAALPAFFLPKQHVLMGLAGLGTDVRLAPHFGLRLEAGDRIYKPKVWEIVPPANPATVAFTTTTGDNMGKTVHEVYAQVGLHYLMGLAAPPVVAVAPAPAPPPPPPEPTPVVTTQNVDVCVVDPTAPGGLRTVTAQFNPSTNDTTVIVNGTSMPLTQSVGTVTVASNQPWYVQGQPLMIGTGRGSMGYVSFGSARNIGASDLMYIGTVNGLPVYANRADVATITIPTPAGEISSNPALMTSLRNVQVLYVPLTPTGCDFQPVQLQQQVRKVRG